MRRITRELIHDLKEMGIHLWMIPLAAFAFIAMTYLVQIALDAAGKRRDTRPNAGTVCIQG